MPKEHKRRRHAHHQPLGKEIDEDNKTYKEVKTRKEEKPKDESYIPSDLSRKILNIAHDQQMEIKEDDMDQEANTEQDFHFKVPTAEDEDDMDDLSSDEGEVEEFIKDYHIEEEDDKALNMFFAPDNREKQNLADLILQKIYAKEAQLNPTPTSQLDEKVIKVYTSVGKILHFYRAGKLPKAFKIIPSLSNWEEILWITEPQNWSPQAMFAATRIFASNLNAKLAQRFYSSVLLPAVLDNIQQYKKLNYHYYQSLKKAMYKPAAFFKGILLPLCEGECTLKEAIIVSSVVAKVSIPMAHSAAALLKLTQLPYSGAVSLFMMVLLNKKYSLPYVVIDALVDYFRMFDSDDRELPVLWQQSLLTFVQRYKTELTSEQKEMLKPVLKKHFHHQITPEIRRELFTTSCRGEKVKEMDVESFWCVCSKQKRKRGRR
ncbi:uncharacterized protein [Blastocystis hominis]|uniref:Bystin n=1 Tax=Blastocystis hominis TaxID=12968 RepID=D8M7K6_BLAHO|nr:uncharacterized protein [Blastocystis hominis]CBK24045.2 unnamed protein product [Blastocystis hominis]|eukprot:XP_012898093.1 uncharacterized protein [Blastocystis hominis]